MSSEPALEVKNSAAKYYRINKLNLSVKLSDGTPIHARVCEGGLTVYSAIVGCGRNSKRFFADNILDLGHIIKEHYEIERNSVPDKEATH